MQGDMIKTPTNTHRSLEADLSSGLQQLNLGDKK
jgi:hypothetical protein